MCATCAIDSLRKHILLIHSRAKIPKKLSLSKRLATVAVGAMLLAPQTAGVAFAEEACPTEDLPDGVIVSGDWYVADWDDFDTDSHGGLLEILWTEGGETTEVPANSGTKLYLRYDTEPAHTDVQVTYTFADDTIRIADAVFDDGRLTDLTWSSDTVPAPAPDPTPPADPEDEDETDEPTPPSFEDVPLDSTHASSIATLVLYNITTGTTETTFDPSGNLSRGQMGTFLVRLLELTDSDVERPESHAAAMQVLVERGLLLGDEDGELNATGTLTRGQAASLLARIIEHATGEDLAVGEHQFPDAGATHGENIAKLTELGVISGYEDNTFRPDVELRRDQMASLIARSINKLIESGQIADLDA